MINNNEREDINKQKEEVNNYIDNQVVPSTHRIFSLKRSLKINKNKKKNLKKKLIKKLIQLKKDKIALNKLLYFDLCCFCLRKRKDNKKELFENGMIEFSQKMDIFNLFQQSVLIEQILKKDEAINIFNNLKNSDDTDNITSNS